ncbi:hypothetical protein [Ruegeria sp.]|uniref:hypothetical protein n=1 Tax=Ruegeria sp. TaxID=1879320 RepID=UPI003AFFB741
MRQGAAYPGPVRACPVRVCSGRSRRGFAALSMVMMLAAGLTATILSWQIAGARDRIDGYARTLSVAVEAEGYALHHWWHGAWHARLRSAGFEDVVIHTARALSGAERAALAAHGAVQGWRHAGTGPVTPLRGWTISHHLAPSSQDRIPGRAVLRLVPDQAMRAAPWWPALRDALEGRLPGTFPAGADCTSSPGSCAMEMDAFHFARIDRGGVLRTRRAGFAPPVMAHDLDMGGCPGMPGCTMTLAPGAAIRADTLAADHLGPFPDGGDVTVAGDIRVAAALLVDGLFTSRSALRVHEEAIFAQGPGLASGVKVEAKTMDVRKGATSVTAPTRPKILVCKNPRDAGCGESGTDAAGTLDLTGGQGVPDWSGGLTIFGDGRAGALDLTGPGRITGTAVFDTLTDADRGRLVVTPTPRGRFRCATCRWLYQ